jgi:hypothetical protein
MRHLEWMKTKDRLLRSADKLNGMRATAARRRCSGVEKAIHNTLISDIAVRQGEAAGFLHENHVNSIEIADLRFAI